MIDLFVQRGGGDIRGPDITDPLITSVAVALARGQVEVDKSTPVRGVQMMVKFRTGLKVGQIVEVLDALQGEAWRGKIVAVDNGVEGIKLTSRLTVERVE